ncbi:hypothetical protein HQN60_06040 [Deefgea piscis]|uniref:Uncharacterized protein n=1 Tax=Deefgea piscis TaxID=2739061 RepID=A0A6M8SQ94_9NEIS|nr:hypothetical protein [Deefgea piscis]QKJ66298.1 hypothetical protein HQN60_06040 [Deefgea piscis]
MEKTIYSKTSIGQQEIAQRSGLISQKERQILLLIDGSRHHYALIEMLPQIDVVEILLKLQNLGLINSATPEQILNQRTFTGPSTLAPDLGQDLKQQRQIEAARQVIMQVTQEYLGQNWEQRLAELLSSVRRAEDFAPIVEQWGIALRRSGYRGAADLGEREVKAVLSN